METNKKIKESLQHLNPKLVEDIVNSSAINTIPESTEILREGQYVKAIPIVLEGLIKLFTRHRERELLINFAYTQI